MLSNLVRLEKFYDSLGGLIGYQLKSLELIRDGGLKGEPSEGCSTDDEDVEYLMPTCLDLSNEEAPEVREIVAHGVQAVPTMAEIYPLGGERYCKTVYTSASCARFLDRTCN